MDEVQADAWRPSPESVLGAISGLGLQGIELGPPGYLGDPEATRSLLDAHGLALVGAYFPLRFTRSAYIDDDLAALRAWLVDLRGRAPEGSSPKAIIADSFCEPDRLAWAGAIDQHPETWLPEDRRRQLVDNIHRAADICREMGFDPVVHPHGGTYIETDVEIRWVAEHVDSARVGLCLDTGHIRFGGGLPAAIAADYPDLIRHVHAKDCDPAVLRQVRATGVGLRAALEQGIFCELGAGDAGIEDVLRTLTDIAYHGWIVLEQDRNVAPGTALSDLTASVERNARFVGSIIGTASAGA